MHLITNGLVRVGDDKGSGMLLLSDRSIFALRNISGPRIGAIPTLIGQMLDKRNAAKNPPEHLNDPEIIALGSKVYSKLLATRLLYKLPLDSTLVVRRTLFGFDFGLQGTTVSYKGWMHKRKITNFLEHRGIRIGRF
jgi:hypothetical protein